MFQSYGDIFGSEIKKRANSKWNGQNKNARNTFALEYCQEARGTPSKSANCAHVFSGGGSRSELAPYPTWRTRSPFWKARLAHRAIASTKPCPVLTPIPPGISRGGCNVHVCMTWQEQNHRLTTYDTSCINRSIFRPKGGGSLTKITIIMLSQKV